MHLLKCLSLAATLSFSLSGLAQAELPQISDARVLQPPPGAKVAAGYFTITNPGSDPLEITDATSNIASQVEVHLSFIENDIAKMQKQESVIVPAGESLEFTHGSFHVMFMGLKETLVAGDSFNLVLNTSAGELPVTVPVISLDESMSMGDMKHDMKNMDHKTSDDMQKVMPDTNMKKGMHDGHDSK